MGAAAQLSPQKEPQAITHLGFGTFVVLNQASQLGGRMLDVSSSRNSAPAGAASEARVGCPVSMRSASQRSNFRQWTAFPTSLSCYELLSQRRLTDCVRQWKAFSRSRASRSNLLLSMTARQWIVVTLSLTLTMRAMIPVSRFCIKAEPRPYPRTNQGLREAAKGKYIARQDAGDISL